MRRIALCAAIGLAMAAGASGTTEITVTIENLAPENGNFLTPVWVGFHDGSFDIYNIGAPATPALERLAEDGATGPLSDAFALSGAGTVDATILGPSGPIAPGEAAVMTFDLDGDVAANRYFSYASMVIPSNDAFVATANPTAHPIFDGLGNFLGADLVLWGDRVRDAGTEVNDELPANTAFFGQAAPDTGVVEGSTVQVHPGFLPAGSAGILDSADFSGADFTLPGYEIARITITAARQTTIRFPLGPDQEVPPTGSTAIGECFAVVNTAGTELDLECRHNVIDAVAAHIHLAPAGQNGSVVIDLGDPSSPIRVERAVTAGNLEDLLAGDYYVNVHSGSFPDGEIRGQIDGCFAGPTTVCLNADRFQVSATFATPRGDSGSAQAMDLTEDAGVFTFFDPDNVELDVKVLDACGKFDRYWVFAAGLTDVEVDLTVTDTETGMERTYSSAQGQPFELIRDVDTFATCP